METEDWNKRNDEDTCMRRCSFKLRLFCCCGVLYPVALIFCVFISPDTLAKTVTRYTEYKKRQESIVITQCSLVSANETGEFKCEPDKSCDPLCLDSLVASYSCIQIVVRVHTNATFHYNTVLYRSPVDASDDNVKSTQCSVYNCENHLNTPQHISEILSHLRNHATIPCYYENGNPDLVFPYKETWNQIITKLVIFSISTFFGAILVFMSLCCCLPLLICYQKYLNKDEKYIEALQVLALTTGDLDRVKKSMITEEDVNKELLYREYEDLYHMEKELYFDNKNSNSPKHKFPPIHIATIHNHPHVLYYLISCGADTTVRDRDNRTALHYALLMRNSKLIRILIKGGCTAECQKYPRKKRIRLTEAILHCDIETIKLLIEVGFPITDDSSIDHDQPSAVYRYIATELHNPAPLQRLCRQSIRNVLGGIKVQERLSLLAVSQGGPLPDKLVSYLRLESFSRYQCCVQIEEDTSDTIPEETTLL